MAEQNYFDQFDTPQQQGVTLGTPKPKKPEVREVGGSLGIVGDDGSFTPTYTPPPKPAAESGGTDAQRANTAYSGRALRALNVYERLGLGPRSGGGEAIAGLPGGQWTLNALPDGIGDSPARQQSEQAKRDFATLVLRSDSGANAPEPEVERLVSIYFPRPGETDTATIENYRQARIEALNGIRLKAGLQPLSPEDTKAIGQNDAPQDAPPPPANQTPSGTHIYDDSQNAGNVNLSDTGTHTGSDPRLQGVNGQVNELIKQGAPNGVILKLLKDRGGTTQGLMSVNQQLNKIRQFQKENPDYHGDFNVDLEKQDVPNTAYNDWAMDPNRAALLAAGDTYSGGHLDNVVGALGGDAEMANLGVQLSREKNPGMSLAGDIAGGAALYATGASALRGLGVAAAPEGAVGALAPRAMAGDAALGGWVSSGQGGTQIVDPANAAKGAGLGLVTGVGGRGALNTVASAVSPTGGALAPIYEAGGRPTLGQRAGAAQGPLSGILGRSVNRAEQAFGSVPILGGVQRAGRNAAVAEMQRGAFNDALGELKPFNSVLGKDVSRLPKGLKKGKAAHAFMQRSFDEAYDRARSGMRFSPDEQLVNDIDAMAEDAGLLIPESQTIVKRMSDEIGFKLNAAGGTLNGDQFKAVVSRIGKKIGDLRSNPKGDTELANVLQNMKQAVEDAARRQSDPQAVALLDAADAGYAKAVIIENAGKTRGGEAGDFNGTQLDASVQRTDKSRRSRAYLRGEARMQEYGEAAKKLGDELGDSGTAERAATMAAGAGAAHFISPYALLPWAVDTAANLPGVRQGLGALMAPRPQSIRGMTDKGRSLIELLARYGTPAAIPGSVTE